MKGRIFYFFPFIVLIFLGLVFFGGYFIFGRKEIVKEETTKNLTPRLIDGVLVEKSKENPPLAAAVIDNFLEARPAVGLTEANLVIEAPAEAAITRFLAFFNLDQRVEKIGPIRSARPYFIDWAMGWDVPLAHVGGSAEALEKIKNSEVLDLNQFYEDQIYFWRQSGRLAPFNVYTSTVLLGQAWENKKWPLLNFKPWSFKDERIILERQPGLEFTIPHLYNDKEYEIKWQYNFEENNFWRWQGGQPHLDEAGKQIKAKNVAIIFTDIEVIDQVGRRRIRTVGEGKALMAIDGKMREGKWRREKSKDVISFFYPDQAEWKEVQFNRGLTWIEVVPLELEGKIYQGG